MPDSTPPTEALGDGYGIEGMHQPCPVCGVPYSYSRQSERRHLWCRDTADPE